MTSAHVAPPEHPLKSPHTVSEVHLLEPRNDLLWVPELDKLRSRSSSMVLYTLRMVDITVIHPILTWLAMKWRLSTFSSFQISKSVHLDGLWCPMLSIIVL